ncbi:MAG TPA: hypothetical protein VD884_04905 [Ohtaekwangia sp.]|nr:hypothetical protein [Ohtaekwangia sp.]
MKKSENSGSEKNAGTEIKTKQSDMDKAVNKAKEENYISRGEEERIRTRRDGSEKRS